MQESLSVFQKIKKKERKPNRHLKNYWESWIGVGGGRADPELLFQVCPPQMSSEVSEFAAITVTAAVATAASQHKSGTKKGE